MAVMRKVVEADFERVYPLLLKFQNPKLTRECFRRLFVDHAGSGEGYHGFLVEEAGQVAGYIGCIFSHRRIRGQVHRICNMTSWIVDERFRGHGHGLALFREVLGLEDMTITALTPTAASAEVCRHRFGMTEFDASQRIILPLPASGGGAWRCRIHSDPEILEAALDKDAGKIVHDHAFPHVHNFLIRTAMGDCHVVLNRSPKSVRRGLQLPFARVHHISNVNVFLRALTRFRLEIPVRMGVVGLIVEDRYLAGAKIPFSFVRPEERTAFLKSSTLGPADIDGLYSEQLLLNY